MTAMHATNPHGYHANQHLPPSPPPSPPSTRRRHKKKPDAFEQLATTPLPSAPSSPASEPEDEKEPLLTRIILTPLLFISFLVSLFFVNYRDRARRTQAHGSGNSILTYLVPWSWLDPEPYQDPDDGTWGRRGTVRHVEPHDAIGPRSDEQSDEKKPHKIKEPKKKSWHLNRKIRKVAKLEIGDALEMRERVMLGMAVVMVLACAALCMGFKWLYVSMSHALSGVQT